MNGQRTEDTMYARPFSTEASISEDTIDGGQR